MKVACFIGKHTKDTTSVRLGWFLTRLVQKGQFKQVTHVEAILYEYEDGSVTIGSASLREGGVRIKKTKLASENWIIFDIPEWDEIESASWFAIHNGEKYDWRGAFASWLPFSWSRKNQWFCNEAVAASVGLSSPEIFGPAQFAAICHSLQKQTSEA